MNREDREDLEAVRKAMMEPGPSIPFDTIKRELDLDISLEELAASRPSVICEHCKEPIVHDGDIYRHVRTGLSAMGKSKECHPLCKFCGERARFSLGGECFDGSRIRFMIHHFACEACVKKSGSGFVERIR